jgi:putative flippase GtrA
MVSKIKALWANEKIREMVVYVIFGALTTLVNWAVYFAMTSALGPDAYPDGSAQRALILNSANITAWVLSVLFAFITNKRYVFRSEEKKLGAVREFFLFLSARVMSYLLFDLLLYNISVFALGIDHAVVKLLMNVLVVIFNYFASRFVVFRKK